MLSIVQKLKQFYYTFHREEKLVPDSKPRQWKYYRASNQGYQLYKIRPRLPTVIMSNHGYTATNFQKVLSCTGFPDSGNTKPNEFETSSNSNHLGWHQTTGTIFTRSTFSYTETNLKKEITFPSSIQSSRSHITQINAYMFLVKLI